MPQVAKLLSLGLIIVGGCMALFTPQGRAMFDDPWEVNIFVDIFSSLYLIPL